jgi:hypothetical protein
MPRNIAAHTKTNVAPAATYVDYVSINFENNGLVSICVRQDKVQATILLTRGEYMEIVQRSIAAFTTAA